MLKLLRCICWLVTLEHWWKHYPGKKAFVKCRICGKLPDYMWLTLRKIQGKPVLRYRKMSFVTHFATDISFDGRWLKVACEAEDFDSETPFSPDATADINMVSCSVC